MIWATMIPSRRAHDVLHRIDEADWIVLDARNPWPADAGSGHALRFWQSAA